MSEDLSAPLSAEGVNALAAFVIRPPRAAYHRRDLGHRRFRTRGVREIAVTRTDLQLVNSRGLTLQCSHYIPDAPEGSPSSSPMPVVVYLHGNGSCRVEGEILFDQTLPYGMSVFAFDFSGSGKSEGKYISLGVFEKFDVQTVVNYLASCDHVSSIALWGHSMGAATATMYAGLLYSSGLDGSDDLDGSRSGKLGFLPSKPKVGALVRGGSFISRRKSASSIPSASTSTPAESDSAQAGSSSLTSAPASADAAPVQLRERPLVKALVLDSAFASFDKLANAMVETMPLPGAVPRRLILSVGVRAVRKAVREQAGFDVHDIDPLSACKKIHPGMTAIFLQGTRDEIVHAPHVDLLVDAYPGNDKQLVMMKDIDHDAPRPSYAIEKAFVVLQRTLFDDLGTQSIRFSNALKVRGNDAMVEGRFDDAIFLYTAALESVVQQEAAQREHDGSKLVPVRGTSSLADVAASRQSDRDASVEDNVWPASDDDESQGEWGASPMRSERRSLRPPSSTDRISSRFSSSVRKLSRSGSRRRSAVPSDQTAQVPSRRRKAPFSQNRGQVGLNNLVNGIETPAPSDADTPVERNHLGHRAVDGPTQSASTDTGRMRFPKLPAKRGSFRLSRGDSKVSKGEAVEPKQNRGNGRMAPSSPVGDDSAVVQDVEQQRIDIGRSIRAGLSCPSRKETTLALLGNRSLARLKKNDFHGALDDSELAVVLDSKWVRGYQRKATALKSLGRIDDARLAVMAGLRISPDSSPLLAMECELEDEALAAAFAASMRDQEAGGPDSTRNGEQFSVAGSSTAGVEGVSADGFFGDRFDGTEAVAGAAESDGTVQTSAGRENEAVA